MIKLSNSERRAVKRAWETLDQACDRAHENGASARVIALRQEALKLAKQDSPDAAPRLDGARASVFSGVLLGLTNPNVPMRNVATCTAWYLLSVALGTALADHLTADQFTDLARQLRAGSAAYTTARDRWLDYPRIEA